MFRSTPERKRNFSPGICSQPMHCTGWLRWTILLKARRTQVFPKVGSKRMWNFLCLRKHQRQHKLKTKNNRSVSGAEKIYFREGQSLFYTSELLIRENYDRTNSIVFLQFPWPQLATICILTKDLHLFFSSRHVSTTSALVTWWFWLEWSDLGPKKRIGNFDK